MPQIVVKNLSIDFNKITILKDISFSVSAGEILVILGASGSGKSTILHSIAGLQTDFKGEILLDNVSIKKRPRNCKKLGYIFQNYALFPHLNVIDNIAFGLNGINKSAKMQRVNELLDQFQIQNIKNQSINQISGGQQQRVAIARAIAYNPNILLLDEPFANLDTKLKIKASINFRQLVRKLRLSAVLVTHDHKEALNIADKILVLNNGSIAQYGSPKQLFEQPKDLFIAQLLGDINILPKKTIKVFKLQNKYSKHVAIRVNKTRLTNQVNDFPLTLQDCFYCGDYCEARLNFDDGSEIICRSQNCLKHAIGNTFYLNIKAEDLFLI